MVATSQKNFVLIGLRSQKNIEYKEIEMSLLKPTFRIKCLAGSGTITTLTMKIITKEIMAFHILEISFKTIAMN